MLTTPFNAEVWGEAVVILPLGYARTAIERFEPIDQYWLMIDAIFAALGERVISRHWPGDDDRLGWWRTSRECSMRSLLLVLMLCNPVSALAQQNGPLGIAFVQAPEQSSGMALGRTPAEGFARATAQCVEGGALAEDCFPTAWCQPAGWSVDVFVMNQEGLHWHEVVCGLPGEAIAQSVGAALCARDLRPYVTDCVVTQVLDPDGVVQTEK